MNHEPTWRRASEDMREQAANVCETQAVEWLDDAEAAATAIKPNYFRATAANARASAAKECAAAIRALASKCPEPHGVLVPKDSNFARDYLTDCALRDGPWPKSASTSAAQEQNVRKL